MTQSLLVAMVLIGAGLLLCAVSLPLWRGQVAPNRLYGFRTPRLNTNPELWFPANRIMGRNIFFAGLVMAIASAVLLVVPPATAQMLLTASVMITVLPLLLAMAHGFYAASVMAATLDGRLRGAAHSEPVRDRTEGQAQRKRRAAALRRERG